jgi:DNA-binding transcriptional LysR family regulator
VAEQSPPPCFDLDVLRTLVLSVELGGFGRAALRIGRTQSAVSLQMRRLEDQAAQPLFTRAGRSFALTPAGEQLLGYARRLLALHDEALAALRHIQIAQPVRLGLLADFAESWLPTALAQFASAHPAARLDVRVDRSHALLDALDQGRLDLALLFGAERPRGIRLAELAMTWIAPPGFTRPTGSLPLVVFESPCVFRAAALDALDRAGMPWHIAFTSQSLGGVWAAVAAGLGVTVRTPVGVPRELAAPRPARAAPRPAPRAGLPPLPTIALWLHQTAHEPSPLVAALRDSLRNSIARAVPASRRTATRSAPHAARSARRLQRERMHAR